MMIEIKTFVFNPFYVNTYVIWDEESKEGAIVDPGCLTYEEEYPFKKFIEKQGINTKYLFNTHCHMDHIIGNKFVMDNFDVEFFAPEDDVFLLDLAEEQAQNYGVTIKPSPKPEKYFSEDLKLNLGNEKLEFLSTPGHTPGEYSIYIPSVKVLLSGDVLFKEAVGRTDLWGGDMNTLLNSIKTKLFELPDDVRVLSGHGEETTIGWEKEHNSFLV